MEIAVTHLTRMQPGYICVAGLDVKTRAHVRPVLTGRLPSKLLKQEDGPFEIGALIDLDGVKHVSSPPEVEDHLFDISKARRVRRLDSKEFWKILSSGTGTDLASIFGRDLKAQANGGAVEEGKGSASLGCLPIAELTLEVNPWQKIRMKFSSGKFKLDLSVTDVRFVKPDFETPNEKAIAIAKEKLARGVPTILCVGLTRAWKKPGDDRRRHWLQVNNIHFSDDPLGLEFK
jgi:hypothetical protein